MKIDRHKFLAIALTMGLQGAANGCIIVSEEGSQAQQPQGDQDGTSGGEVRNFAVAPQDEGGVAPADECVGWDPSGECVQWAGDGEVAPADECVDWDPSGECIGWAGDDGPAMECIDRVRNPDGSWDPTGECVEWEPIGEA